MIMNESVIIGPLVIPVNFVSYGLAIFAVLLYYLKWHTAVADREKRLSADILLSAFFYALLAWKLSPLLFRPLFFLQDPVLLLFYRGGYKELWVAVLVFSVYLLFKTKKQSLPLVNQLNLLILITIVAGFIQSVLTRQRGNQIEWTWLADLLSLEAHPVHLYQMFWHVLLLMWIVWQGFHPQSVRWLGQALAGFSSGQLLISTAAREQMPLLGLIEPRQFYFFLLVIGFIMLIKARCEKTIDCLEIRSADEKRN
ncbi:hypothetical protein GCM10010965_02320 [Caldalkalibacillus thermarum]|nr:hypothetical protein GCM10010965_02320 [Caldalkalibacillus thermarum]